MARARLVESKTAMGVAAAHEETLGQGDQGESGRRAFSRLGDDGFCKRNLYPHPRRAREHEFSSGFPAFSKRMIGRILNQQTAEVGFGAKVAGGNPRVGGDVTSARGFEIVVAMISDVAKARLAHACGLR